jgi:predicted HD phosphohydrolase
MVAMTTTEQHRSEVTSFRRMDESTKEQWLVIGAEHANQAARNAERVLWLLRSLAEITDGFATDQLTHCLQTAALAEAAGADEEVIVASLCHDMGKAVSVANHGAIAAEMLKPYVRDDVYQMIRVHQDFQGKHYYHHFGADPDAREQHRDALTPEQFALAAQFADDWDQVAFDPDYPTPPLEHFEPMVRRVFGFKSAVSHQQG